MELAIFTGLWFFFVGMTVYAIKYFLRGGKSFLSGMPSVILLIIIILMFPGVYQVYKGIAFWAFLILVLAGISIFLIAIPRK